jgi:phosphatidylserine/phosphatidylglycerophosphate/cardiolipin synthase-like enzyme
MRVTKIAGDFKVKAISGIHTVLLALDCAEQRRHGLRGFGIKRGVVGSGQPEKWLRSQKVFRSVEPNPKSDDPDNPKRFYTSDHPIQSFLWGDYAAQPDTEYTFTVVPMYGKPGALEPRDEIKLTIRTEKEFDQGQGVWFNRGAIASQKFAEEFGNHPPNDINNPKEKEVVWLSRGLLEACLRYINETPAGDGLRVAAYEFTYPPILNALKAALDNGVDVRIVYHDTTKAEGKEKRLNEDAIEKAELPKHSKTGQQVLFARTKTKIPHNKFIVRLRDNKTPAEVWTGSTNFTPSGFLGQTNVGHRVQDAETARQYLDYWEILKTDPDRDELREEVLKLTPDPAALIEQKSIVRVFSPRAKAKLLSWYGDRMEDCANSVMFTAAFGVAKQLVPAIAKKRNLLRFILMEKPATDALKAQFKPDRFNIIMSYGVPLGQLYRFKNGKPVARQPIAEFELDKWFLKEDHFRRKNEGFVFFVHTKFLLIDPLSDDPLVCSGSANFSSNSLLQNDENMLLIRGDTRVADIYMTEFDRIFRHFYFRDIANELHEKGDAAKGAFLDETDGWTESYFRPSGLKSLRRQMFFADPKPTWFQNAAARSNQPAKKKAAGKGTKKTSAKKSAKKTKSKTTKAKAKSTKKRVAKKKTAKKSAAKKKSAKKTSKKRAKVRR